MSMTRTGEENKTFVTLYEARATAWLPLRRRHRRDCFFPDALDYAAALQLRDTEALCVYAWTTTTQQCSTDVTVTPVPPYRRRRN
jgi:hypothetical protein